MRLTPVHYRVALAGALALAAAAAPPRAGASFHLHLERSDPMADSTVTAEPRALRLWFSQAPELGVTTVRLTGEDARPVALGALTRERAAGAPVVAPVRGPMAPGRYLVAWRTMSRDGHPVSGSFAFRFAGPTAPR